MPSSRASSRLHLGLCRHGSRPSKPSSPSSNRISSERRCSPTGCRHSSSLHSSPSRLASQVAHGSRHLMRPAWLPHCTPTTAAAALQGLPQRLAQQAPAAAAAGTAWWMEWCSWAGPLPRRRRGQRGGWLCRMHLRAAGSSTCRPGATRCWRSSTCGELLWPWPFMVTVRLPRCRVECTLHADCELRRRVGALPMCDDLAYTACRIAETAQAFHSAVAQAGLPQQQRPPAGGRNPGGGGAGKCWHQVPYTRLQQAAASGTCLRYLGAGVHARLPTGLHRMFPAVRRCPRGAAAAGPRGLLTKLRAVHLEEPAGQGEQRDQWKDEWRDKWQGERRRSMACNGAPPVAGPGSR